MNPFSPDRMIAAYKRERELGLVDAIGLTAIIVALCAMCAFSVSGCAPSGVKLPSQNVVYELYTLPDGAAGWVCHVSFTVNSSGELCVLSAAPVFPKYETPTEGEQVCLAILRKDGKLYAFLPKEHEKTVFSQGEMDNSVLIRDYVGIDDLLSPNMAIETLEQTIREGLITEKLVSN